MKAHRLLLAALLLAVASSRAATGDLLARLSFDDAGNGGANLLRATVGADAIVRATPATPVEGIGGIAAVADAALLSGLPAGDGAVAITNGQYLAVPVPAALASAAGRPYTVVMRIRVPDTVGWRSLLNMPASNDTDALVYLQQSTRNIYLKQFDKSSGSGVAASHGNVPADQWTTIAFAFGEGATDVYLNGTNVLHNEGGTLAGSYADCAAAGGYILVGADDSYDDDLFYLSELRVYEGAVAAAGVLPGSGTAADPWRIASVADWNAFAANVALGFGDSDHYRLDADVGPVSVSAGDTGHPFRGTFDGDGRALDVALSSASQCCAPFGSVIGAAIRNLRTTGTVAPTGSGTALYHASGLVGGASGVTIERCRSSVAITFPSSAGAVHSGGFIGHAGSAPFTMTDCVFDGSIGGSASLANVGGLVGWDDASTPDISNCLNAGTFSNPGVIARIARVAGRGTVANCYSTVNATSAGSQNDDRGTYTTATGTALRDLFGPGWMVTDVAAAPVHKTPPHDGSAYAIASAADWDAFAASVRAGKRYLGQTVRLAANGVLATNAAGTGARPFGGTFDGEGRTLAVALAGTGYYVAPFSSVSNATIRGLAISGTVEGGMHCSGLVGYAAGGANEIADCTVAAAVTTTNSHCGGVVGHAGGYYGPSATALRGCVFAGSVPDAATVGTFYGWGDNLSEVTLLDSFDASSTAQPIGRGSFRSLTVSNAYYAASSKATGGSRSWPLGGKRAFSVTAGEGVAIDFGAPAATYAASGLAAYAPGLSRAGVFYAGSGETVALGLSASPPVGKALDAYAPSAGTLAAAGGAWTLAMPAADIVVGATWRAVLGGSGTAADPFRIASVADWNELADAAERGQDTAGLHFVLTADVGPVARTVGTEEHPFSGVFDGAGHALDLAIADTANRGTAPFRYIKDAILLGVKTTGTVSGTMHCSGLAGFADGTNLVLQCEVAAAVSCGGSPHTHCGGILGHGGSSATTLRNCLFSGSIAGATGATGVLYGWGDYGAYAIESCLAAGTYDGCAGVDLLRTYGGTGSVANCYRRTEGGTQGLDARDMADGDLVAALGPCWEVRGGKVVPAVLGPLDLALAAVDGVAVFYPLNADGSGVAQPVPAVRDLFGATVDPAFYAATVRDDAGDVVSGDLPLGDYVLAVRALDGNAGGYTGSNAVSFAVCPAGLSVDPDYGPGETGRYFATIPASGTNTVTLPDGFAAPIKVYDDGGKDGNYGDDWDGLLVLTAPSGRCFRISGTIATEADHFDWLTVYDGADDTAAKLVDERYSASSGVPEAIPATVGGNRSMALRFHSDDLTNDSGLDLTAEPVRAVDLASLAGDITLADGDYVFGALSGRYKVSVADGATVTLRGATIAGADDPACPWAGLTCLGDATIVLEGASAVTGFLGDYPGIYVPEGRTLSVRGYGSLSATTHGDGAPVVGAVALAAGGTDTTDGPTRVLAVMVVDLAQLRGDRVLVDGEVATGALGGAYKVSVADGATVTLLDATIDGASSYGSPWAGLTCLGNAAIVLKGANFLEGPYAGYPGLFVPSGKTLAIRGDGSLEAAGDSAPGIGALADAGCGTIVIEGGTVRATGTGVAAGIGCGSGNSASCDGIVVRGGTVVARGGGDMSDNDGGAGIGGSYYNGFGSVVIDGGSVTAYGGYWADGIGCGDGDVTINGGTVTAYGGSYGSGIGGCDTVTINGGTVDADGGAECPGIGGGCDSVVIAGGTVTAVGGCDGAGIGAGTSCSCGPVTIGPDIVRVTATCDDASDCQPIGNGYGGTCSSVTVAPGLRDTTTDLTRVIEPVQPALPGSGTEADPYLIESADHWRALGELVLYGAETAGKRYLLASNIVAATTVGTEERPFAGVFDGGGRTLTADIRGSASTPHFAPFRAISGATISNLVVAGTVVGGAYSAGLVGYVAGGTNLVENCLVSAGVRAIGSPYCAGIVGHGGGVGATTLAGCAFTGSLTGSSLDEYLAALFWGGSDGPDPSTGAPGAAVTIVDCFAPHGSTSVGRGDYASLRVENVYFDGVAHVVWPSDKCGRRAWSVTAGENVSIDFGEPAATYATSGIDAYGPGIAYGGTFYAGEGETVPLSLASTASGNLVFEADGGVLARDGAGWLLTMPADNVVVSAAAPRYAVTIMTNALVRTAPYLLADGVQRDDYTAPEGARVTVSLGSTGPKWAVESVSVVAEGGGTVQSTFESGMATRPDQVSFTMPGSPVVVTPVVVPARYPELQLGDNAVAAAGVYAFVAPTNASYSFDFGSAQDWSVEAVFDETIVEALGTTVGSAHFATLAAGPTYYVVISGPAGSGGATLTIAKAGDVVAYPVAVLVSGRGTVEANSSSAPAGCAVLFTAVPDPGWEPGECLAFGSDGMPMEVLPVPDGTAWFVRMPAGPITVWAMFAKVLDLGENEAPFSAGVIAGTFVAPEDGLYRFHVSCERWLNDVDFTIHDAAGDWVDFGNSYPDGIGGYDLFVTLSAGKRYYFQAFSPFDLSAEATVLVSRCTAHSVAVDDDVAHGRIVHSQTGLDAVTEGTWVPLSAESDDGYEFGGWNVVDATGASVPVTWDDDRCRWRFTMPGADVLVSATFGRERWVDIESTGRARCIMATINGRDIDAQYGFKAATGADVVLTFAVCPGWELSSCRADASDGSLVPCTVQAVDDGSRFAIVRFRMPAARVFVTPVPARIDVPELVLGPNAIERDGVRDFVAPTSGVYSIALANGDYWRMVLVDDAGGELGEAADGESATATLAAGGVCHVWFQSEAIGVGTMPTATVARVLDVETHPVSVAWEGGGTVVASASEAPEGAIVAFRTVPDPGWGLGYFRAVDENGDYLYDGRSGAGGEWRVRMPDAGIRFEATFVPERELVLGENAVLFSDDMPRYVFVAPEDGWYRFRSTGARLSGSLFVDADGRELNCRIDGDANGNLDAAIELAAGSACRLDVWYDSPNPAAGTIVVSRCAAGPIELDAGVSGGRIAAVDADGNPVAEAMAGTRVYLESEPATGRALGGWFVTDASGAPVDVYRDWEAGLWYFRMPDGGAFVSATFGGVRRVTAAGTERCWFRRLEVNGRETEENFDYAAAGADVFVEYWLAPGWRDSTFSVETADGTPVPFERSSYEDGDSVYAYIRFRMPDADVVVSATEARNECTALALGDNTVASGDGWTFLAQAGGAYSFASADPDGWYLDIYDDRGSGLGDTEEDPAVVANLETGELVHVCIRGAAGATTTLTISRTGDAPLYPVTVLPTPHGTVAGAVYESPAGRRVWFAATPDLGWRLADFRTTDTNGNELDLDGYVDGSYLTFRMPEQEVVLDVAFERDCVLLLGENPVLFEDGMPEYSFYAPADGWYRFRSTTGAGGIEGASLDYGLVDFPFELDENGEFDGTVFLEGETSYNLEVVYNGASAVEASIVVDLLPSYVISVDDNVAHGRIAALDKNSNPATAALEGSWIELLARPEEGYEFGGWNIVDANGEPVPVEWDDREDCWYFWMPGSDVSVSATFGYSHRIVAKGGLRTNVASLFVNGKYAAPWPYAEAAPGADVRVWYEAAPGWKVASFTLATATGASVPCAVETDEEEPGCFIARFRMPDAHVVVTPVEDRVDLPELDLGDNTIEAAGDWSFVAPADGEYSFSIPAESNWGLFLCDDMGVPLGMTGKDNVVAAPLAAGETCYASFRSGGGGPIVATVSKTGDATTYPVSLVSEHAAAEGLPSALPADRSVSFRLVPERGWAVEDVVAKQADGTTLDMLVGEEWVGFAMPASAVTIEVKFVPGLPWYLEFADDDVMDNYYRWARQYGDDPFGTNLVAFLLDADPAEPVAEGAAPLRVADFAVTNGTVLLELASDRARLSDLTQDGPGASGALRSVDCMLGNGYLVLRTTDRLGGEWTTWPLSILEARDDGCIVARPGTRFPGVPGLVGSGQVEFDSSLLDLPSGFFRPALTTIDPAPAGNGGGGGLIIH